MEQRIHESELVEPAHQTHFGPHSTQYARGLGQGLAIIHMASGKVYENDHTKHAPIL